MSTHSLACILPPDLLVQLSRSGTKKDRLAALDTLQLDHSFRQLRAETAGRQTTRAVTALSAGAGGSPKRSIYDQEHSDDPTPGRLVRSEGSTPVADSSVNAAYDGFGATYKMYWDVFQRDSIDNQGMPIVGLVHFGDRYDNAFFDGIGKMYFGDETAEP